MTIDAALKELSGNETNIRFVRLVTIAKTFFGSPRIKGSHHIFKTPWPGDPRINLQKEKGKAKYYQFARSSTRLKDSRGHRLCRQKASRRQNHSITFTASDGL